MGIPRGSTSEKGDPGANVAHKDWGIQRDHFPMVKGEIGANRDQKDRTGNYSLDFYCGLRRLCFTRLRRVCGHGHQSAPIVLAEGQSGGQNMAQANIKQLN